VKRNNGNIERKLEEKYEDCQRRSLKISKTHGVKAALKAAIISASLAQSGGRK
jgi:N-glycosylase/DNA lyase